MGKTLLEAARERRAGFGPLYGETDGSCALLRFGTGNDPRVTVDGCTHVALVAPNVLEAGFAWEVYRVNPRTGGESGGRHVAAGSAASAEGAVAEVMALVERIERRQNR